MSYIKHIKSPFQEMALEGKSLTVDEYSKLSELFKESRGRDFNDNTISDINMYIERFSLDSKVVLYFNNWSKTTTQSDSYMNLILHLRRLSESVYRENFFQNLL